MEQTPLGQEVRRYRTMHRLSQEEVAEQVGVTRETISQIETGKNRRPRTHVLEGLERVLGLPHTLSLRLITDDKTLSWEDPAVTLQAIAALPDRDQRLQAWAKLPVELRNAVIQLMQDILFHAAQRP